MVRQLLVNKMRTTIQITCFTYRYITEQSSHFDTTINCNTLQPQPEQQQQQQYYGYRGDDTFNITHHLASFSSQYLRVSLLNIPNIKYIIGQTKTVPTFPTSYSFFLLLLLSFSLLKCIFLHSHSFVL